MKPLLMLFLLLLPAAVSTQSYLEGFEESLDRCQAALETEEGFSAEGIEQIEANEDDIPPSILERGMWRVPGSIFYIVHAVLVDSRGQRRSMCEVSLNQDHGTLSAKEVEALSHSFTARMERQITDGSHVPRDMVSIPPLVTYGYGPLIPGPHGCRVMVTLAFDRDGTFFKVIVGEQITHPCNQ